MAVAQVRHCFVVRFNYRDFWHVCVMLELRNVRRTIWKRADEATNEKEARALVSRLETLSFDPRTVVADSGFIKSRVIWW